MGVAAAGAGRSAEPGAGRGPRVLIVVNAEWYFLSHRLSLAMALRDHGCEVAVAATVERDQQTMIEDERLRFVPLHLRWRSVNPLYEAASLLELFRLYRRERPGVVHQITIKPVVYGSVAARMARVPQVINTIRGLGYAFLGGGIKASVLRRAVSLAYRPALADRRVHVIFQNPEDRDLSVARRIVKPDRARVIRRSWTCPVFVDTLSRAV